MTTITIPKKLIREKDLVVIPRKEYERFLRLKKKPTYTQLDRRLDAAIAEHRAGKFFGPFKTVKEGVKFLESRRGLKRKK